MPPAHAPGERDSGRRPRCARESALIVVLAALVSLGAPGAASSEIIEFTSGRTLSVKSHRIVGDRAVLVMRSGGEVECDARLIAAVRPDEVPYPTPAAGAPDARAGDLDRPYAAVIAAAAERHGLDARLLAAVIEVESNFVRRARSPKGAMGLMQLMPATARQYALENPFDPSSNVDAGARHLKSLLERFSLEVALAAYNAGEGAVARYGGVPPYPETREYIRRVLRLLDPGQQSS